MALTLGLTGMDQATETALRSAFSDANARVGNWVLVNENDADYIIVDMDSMYGPMSWLRLHAAGKRVIGLTAAPRTQTDFRLARPFDAVQMAALLAEIAGVAPAAAPPPPPTTSAAVPPPPPLPDPLPAIAPRAPAPAAPVQAAPVATPPPPQPQPPAPVAAPQPLAAQAAPVQAPAPMPAAPAPVAQAPAPPKPAPAPAPAAPPPAATAPAVAPGPEPASSGAAFLDWLRPGALSGRAQFKRGNGPAIFIDFGQRVYYGPATLKALAEYFSGSAGLRDFEQLDESGWQPAIAKLGEPQPLTRLLWFGGLLAGQGQLLQGLDPDGRFVLHKWPQTEREFPKHFRIATAMMKGPQTVAEIAAASGSPAADVADFINANIATGFAEPVGGAPVGLFDRLRGGR